MVNILTKHKTLMGAMLIVAAILVAFWPALFNGFLHWDDFVLVVGNPLITGHDGIRFKDIFLTMVTRAYMPLTILSFGIEHIFFKLNPFFYHLDNLILHIATTLLIYYLFLRLRFSWRASFFAALLFAIHPIHVVSVATVSERKDVLYALFYLLAIHQYLSYLETKRVRPYLLSIACCLLSLLAKPMALSLPFALFLIEWLYGRKFSERSIADKVPFFIIIIPLAWITYSFHMHVPFNAHAGPLIWIWSFVFYLQKFLFPLILTPLYILPQPVTIGAPDFLIAVGLFLAFLFSLFRFRKDRLWLFASGFYFISIFYLLRFNVAGDTPVVADQYMYLASLGFCLFIGYHLDLLITFFQTNGKTVFAVIICIFLLLAAKTYAQCGVWRNDLTFLTVIAHDNPGYRTANNLLGHHYLETGQYAEAIQQFQKALGYEKSRDYWIYGNIGMAYVAMGDQSKAIASYDRALELNPQCPENLMNRATVFDEMGLLDKAFADYSTAIKYNQRFAQAYHNRAIIFYRRGEFELAVQDLSSAIDIIPDFTTAYYFRGQIYAIQGAKDKALHDLDVALRLKPDLTAARIKKEALLAGHSFKEHPALDIPPDTFVQGPWKPDQYKNYLPDKDYLYQL
jgi:protein O-mannosyl-transferase